MAAAGLEGGPLDGPPEDALCGGPGPVLAGKTDLVGPFWGALTFTIPLSSGTVTLTALVTGV